MHDDVSMLQRAARHPSRSGLAADGRRDQILEVVRQRARGARHVMTRARAPLSYAADIARLQDLVGVR